MPTPPACRPARTVPSYTATQRDEADENDQGSVETSGETAHDKLSQVFLQANREME